MTNNKAQMIGREAAKSGLSALKMAVLIEQAGGSEATTEIAYQAKMAEQRRMDHEAATFSSH